MELDIAIVGGGPAGAATALALLDRPQSGNWRIGILERSDRPVFRVGESVPPRIQMLLSRLGVFERFQQGGHLPIAGNCSAWGDNTLGFNDFWTSVGGRGWHLDRAQFDATLLQVAAERGATVKRGVRVAGCERTPQGQWRLHLDKPDRARAEETTQVTASFVVDASGARSVFARWQGAHTIRMDSLLGLAGIFGFESVTNNDVENRQNQTSQGFNSSRNVPTGYTLVEATEWGWWYVAHLPGHRLIVTLMSDRDLVRQYRLSRRDQWLAALHQTEHVRHWVKGAVQPDQLNVQPAFSQYLDPVRGEDWLAVGDAACKFDPLSSAGIYKALQSGLEAGEAIVPHQAGQVTALEAYHLKTQHRFELYLEDRRRYYSQETRWPASPFWQRRQGQLTLAPTTVLSFRASPQSATQLKRLDRHLPPTDLQALCHLCRSPRAASEVVAQFLAQRALRLSAYRPIEALQYLVEQRVIEAA